MTVSDVTGATLYLTPYVGNRIALFDGTAWNIRIFTERSLALTVTSGKNYDIFAYDNAGVPALELSAAWTNDTTRADALTRQDGILSKSSGLTRRYLGTLRASAANQTADTATSRFLANYYNRVQKSLMANPGYSNNALDTTYWMVGGWAKANGGVGSGVSFLSMGEEATFIQAQAVYNTDGVSVVHAGPGIDSTVPGKMGCGYVGQIQTITVNDSQVLSAGYHTVDLYIYAGGNSSQIYADRGSTVTSPTPDPRASFVLVVARV